MITMTRGGHRGRKGEEVGSTMIDGNGVLGNDNDVLIERVPRMRHMKATHPERPCTPECPHRRVLRKPAHKMTFFDDAAQLAVDNGTSEDATARLGQWEKYR